MGHAHADEHVLGDLQLHPDDTADGWCFSPARPEAPLAFDILVDDRVVAGGEAALPRPDLSVHGMTDPQHGFRLALPPGALDRAAPCLVSARARDSRVVFGRRLLEPAEGAPAEPAVAALQADLGSLSDRLTAALQAISPAKPGMALRMAAGDLATALPARSVPLGAAIAAARAKLARLTWGLSLDRAREPQVSVLLRASPTVSATIARLRALAPAAHALAAETLLVDPGEDARVALLPSLIPGLQLLRAPDAPSETTLALAGTAAGGAWLLLLDAAPCSAAGLQQVLARLETEAIVLAVTGASGMPILAVPARTGLLLAVRRSLLAPGDTPASLLTRAIRLQARCVALAEPPPSPR